MDARGGMHNEGVPLGSNVMPILVAAEHCSVLHKIYERLNWCTFYTWLTREDSERLVFKLNSLTFQLMKLSLVCFGLPVDVWAPSLILNNNQLIYQLFDIAVAAALLAFVVTANSFLFNFKISAFVSTELYNLTLAMCAICLYILNLLFKTSLSGWIVCPAWFLVITPCDWTVSSQCPASAFHYQYSWNSTKSRQRTMPGFFFFSHYTKSTVEIGACTLCRKVFTDKAQHYREYSLKI